MTKEKKILKIKFNYGKMYVPNKDKFRFEIAGKFNISADGIKNNWIYNGGIADENIDYVFNLSLKYLINQIRKDIKDIGLKIEDNEIIIA